MYINLLRWIYFYIFKRKIEFISDLLNKTKLENNNQKFLNWFH